MRLKHHHYSSVLSACKQKFWQVFGQFMANFWQTFFRNGNVFGNIDFSILIFFNSYFIHTFQFLKFDS